MSETGPGIEAIRPINPPDATTEDLKIDEPEHGPPKTTLDRIDEASARLDAAAKQGETQEPSAVGPDSTDQAEPAPDAPASQTPGSQEAPAPVDTKEDNLPDLTRKQRTGGALGSAQQYIREGLKSGKYESDEEKTRVKLALEYTGDKTPEELSPALKETISLLREMRDSAPDSERGRYTDVYAELTRNMVVVVDGEAMSFEDFEKAKEEAVANGDQARLEALDNGIYGFKFEILIRANSAIDQGLDEIEKEIKDAKKTGRDVEVRRSLKGKLIYARETDGPVGIILKEQALRELVNVAGIKSVDGEFLAELQQELPEAERQFFNVLTLQEGYSTDEANAIIGSIRKGDYKVLIEKGVFKRTGIENALFGREQTDKEREDLVKKVFEGDPRYESMKDYLMTHKKDVGMMLLMLLYMGMTSDQVKKLIGLP